MGRPRNPDRKISTLAREVKAYRQRHGMNQLVLADELKRLGLKSNRNYVAQVESGSIAKPNDQFLIAFKSLKDQPFTLEQLRGMAEEFPTRASPVTIGCGFSLWSAPFHLLEVGRLNTKTGEVIPRPWEIRSLAERGNQLDTFRLRSVIQNNTLCLPSPNAPDDVHRLQPASARDVLAAKEQCDVIVVPCRVIGDSSFSNNYREVCKIIPHTLPCSLLITAPLQKALAKVRHEEPDYMARFDAPFRAQLTTTIHGWLDGDEQWKCKMLTTQDLTMLVRFMAIDGTMCIACEPATLPHEYLRDAFNRRKFAWTDCIWGSGFAASMLGEHYYLLNQRCQHQMKKSLGAILAFEPQATWAQELSTDILEKEIGGVSSGKNRHWKCGVLLAPDNNNRTSDSHFSVFIQRTRLDEADPDFADIVSTLLTSVSEKCDQINREMDEWEDNPPSETLYNIGTSFQLFNRRHTDNTEYQKKIELVVNALHGIRFHVLFTLEGQRWLTRAARAEQQP